MRTAIILFLCHVGMVSAQETLQLTEGQQSPNATLEDVSWISGHWQGEAFGGIAEEIWSPPLGDSMMFVFKLVKDDKVSFYEIGHIQQVENTMILQLKHFQGNLKGWEEKDATVDFKLVKVEKNKVFFEGFTMELVNENEMNIYVLIEDGNSAEEVLFAYKRVP
ncbi:hypothetical protein F8C76_13975 [Flagellimonas olearia]|uniref:DUF6265 domain-containing protein n=1 Tax=Flagellimonas olearia TaxID=552546 RepID=A0A6I1E016_9FLAO|nr:DUF6265 family protein [Allomuricauda olearia]KAB7528952.1 hypothetical protein F8C76_13975 [Allomuricauda olearia]